MNVRISSALVAGMLLVVSTAIPVGAEETSETAFEVSNAPTEAFGPDAALLRPEDARIMRADDRLVVEVDMPTPIPGTYVYPPGLPEERRAPPEAFTLWVFIFNRPEACISSETPPHCGADDFTEAVRAGIYGVAGHVTSVDHSGGAFELDRANGGRMVLHGEIMVGDPPRENMPPDSPTFGLEDPMNAEVHLAVAPHGQIDPATVSTELYEPAGNPTCGCWWVAFFKPPE